MTGLGIALVVIACLAAIFAIDVGWVETSKDNARSWNLTGTFVLLYAGLWFWIGDDK